MKNVKNLCTLAGVAWIDLYQHLDSPGEYIIPVDFTVSSKGMILVNVVFCITEGKTQAIVVRDSKGKQRDMYFNGTNYAWLTNVGQEVNWHHQLGLNVTPGILKEIDEDYFVTPFSFVDKSVDEMMEEIRSKEPDVARAIEMCVKHIHGTYSDKYAKGQDIIDTKKMLYDKERGAFLNIYQVSRYLQRYLTTGSKKSNLIKDIEKAVHYLIFEITRRIKAGDIEEVEPKI